jgi:hypothetical protein
MTNKTKMVDYTFKQSKVNGDTYIQVWKKDPREYVGTIGNAKKSAELLVKLKELGELTKILGDKVTKLTEENNDFLTKLHTLTK